MRANLSTEPCTQATLNGFLDHVVFSKVTQLFTFGPRERGIALRGLKNIERYTHAHLGTIDHDNCNVGSVDVPIHNNIGPPGGGGLRHGAGREWIQKINKNRGSLVYAKFAYWALQRPQKNLWVLWTFSGRLIFSQLALGGREMH